MLFFNKSDSNLLLLSGNFLSGLSAQRWDFTQRCDFTRFDVVTQGNRRDLCDMLHRLIDFYMIKLDATLPAWVHQWKWTEKSFEWIRLKTEKLFLNAALNFSTSAFAIKDFFLSQILQLKTFKLLERKFFASSKNTKKHSSLIPLRTIAEWKEKVCSAAGFF